MSDTTSNNKRLVKNTLLLYVRMFFTMGIALYTSRIILDSLGFEDFGIYNIVGGTVALFSFINITLTGATSRFLAYEIGTGNEKRLKEIFRTSLAVHLIIATLILLLAETIGLWLLYHLINIPDGKFNESFIVYQVSIFTSIIAIIQVPFTASIISHEDMSIYAYVSIFECAAKLTIAFFISCFSQNRLIIYACMIAFVAISLCGIYVCVCKRRYDECVIRPHFNIGVIKPLLSYSVWDLYGNMSAVARTYGVSVILNIFFGALINAATGVANQVQNAVMGFVENFMTAARPQIVKYYAVNERKRMCELIYNASKFSFLLLFLISFPLILEASYILQIWLKDVPDYAVQFTQFSLIMGWNSALFRPVVYGIHSTGKIRNMSLINGSVILCILPLSYFAFQFGASPIWAYILNVVLLFIASGINLMQLQRLMPEFRVTTYVQKVLFDIFRVVLPTVSIVIVLHRLVRNDFLRLCVVSIVSCMIVILFTWFFVADGETKIKIRGIIKRRING